MKHYRATILQPGGQQVYRVNEYAKIYIVEILMAQNPKNDTLIIFSCISLQIDKN